MTDTPAASGRARLRRDLMRFMILIVLPPLLIIPVVHRIFPNPDPNDFPAWAAAARCTGNSLEEKRALAKLIQLEPLNTRYHYRYINVAFDQMEDNEDREKQVESLFGEYRSWAASTDRSAGGIGRFGLGACHLRRKEFAAALAELGQSPNPELPGHQFLTGRAHAMLKDAAEAEICFRNELHHSEFRSLAVVALSNLLYTQGEWDKLRTLLRDSATGPFVPVHEARMLALHDANLGEYLRAIGRGLQNNVNLPGMIGALLITAVWLAFLKRLDIFEPEKDRYLAIALLGGMAVSFLAPMMYNLLEYHLDFEMTDCWTGNLLFCVFGIGLVEELVKAIPLLLMIRFSRQFNESIDYIVYASVSALGFALVENSFYFNESSLFAIEGRGLICVIGHMFYTSLIAYGLLLAKYRQYGSAARNLVLFLLLAAALHGLYDFWLSLENVFSLLAVAQTAWEIAVYNHIVNNALNQSEFFDPACLRKLKHRREKLGLSLIGIVLLEYVLLAWRYGPHLTLLHFVQMLAITLVFVLLLSFGLSNFVPLRKRWTSLAARFQKRNIRTSVQ